MGTLCARELPSWHLVFFFNDTATTEIYTLSLHDALPIFRGTAPVRCGALEEHKFGRCAGQCHGLARRGEILRRSEEHTSELQSLAYLVCRLLLEKTKRQGAREKLRRPQE